MQLQAAPAAKGPAAAHWARYDLHTALAASTLTAEACMQLQAALADHN
jgi:hypothetical protein